MLQGDSDIEDLTALAPSPSISQASTQKRKSPASRTVKDTVKKKKGKATGKAKSKICSRCHRNSHTVENCFAKTTAEGNPIASGPPDSIPLPKNNKRTKGCSRCGRNSHTRETCFAETHLDGSALSPNYYSDSGGEGVYLTERASKAKELYRKKHKKGPGDFPDDGCERCGRRSHMKRNCIAFTDIFGNDLPGGGSVNGISVESDVCILLSRRQVLLKTPLLLQPQLFTFIILGS